MILKKIISILFFVFFVFSVNSEELKNFEKNTEFNVYSGMFDFSDDGKRSTLIGFQHQNENLNRDQKISFINEVALENVDIKALGFYTLGELRKSAAKEDIENYQKTFEKYFLKSLTSRLTDYSSSIFEIIEAEKKSANYTIVSSRVRSADGGPEIKIDWRIYTKNPDKPLIRDLIVEGLSLARTQKEEFASILSSNNNDIKILIGKLEEFVNN